MSNISEEQSMEIILSGVQDLSGKPKSTPKGGYTKRWKPFVAAS